MARIRKSYPYSGSLPHREHRSKKGRTKNYGGRREKRIMNAQRMKKINEKYD